MTAEERLAYFQGEKRRSAPIEMKTKEKNRDVIFFKIKFFIAVLLFVLFLSLDYTGYRILGIGIEDIVREVTRDFEIPQVKE